MCWNRLLVLVYASLPALWVPLDPPSLSLLILIRSSLLFISMTSRISQSLSSSLFAFIWSSIWLINDADTLIVYYSLFLKSLWGLLISPLIKLSLLCKFEVLEDCCFINWVFGLGFISPKWFGMRLMGSTWSISSSVIRSSSPCWLLLGSLDLLSKVLTPPHDCGFLLHGVNACDLTLKLIALCTLILDEVSSLKWECVSWALLVPPPLNSATYLDPTE